MMNIIEKPGLIVISCSKENASEFKSIIEKTRKIDGVGAYQIPDDFLFGYSINRLKPYSELAQDSGKKLIYNCPIDDPEDAQKTARRLNDAKISAVIISPVLGIEASVRRYGMDIDEEPHPGVGAVWIKAMQEAGLAVIVRGLLTYLGSITTEGGFIEPHASLRIYDESVRLLDVRDLQVPANREEEARTLRNSLAALNAAEVRGNWKGEEDIHYYPTGIGRQGGKVGELPEIFGRNVHPVVRSRIVEQPDIEKATKEFLEELEKAYQ